MDERDRWEGTLDGALDGALEGALDDRFELVLHLITDVMLQTRHVLN